MTPAISSPAVYRAGTIRRKRRTNAELEQLDAQILDAIGEDHPQSTRHLFYRMTDPRLPEPVEKSDRGYRHVQDRVVKLRRSGRLRYDWITDASRVGYFTPTYDSGSDFLRRVAGLYRADLWQQAEWYVEVWVESRSIAGLIRQDCEELAVNLYPAGGFTSLSFAYSAASHINYYVEKPVVVFYIGDYDPAGVLIDTTLERELRAHLRPSIHLRFQRIGITAEQIALYDLPTKPRKETDRRSLHVTETVEAEAMPAHIMRQMLRSHIEAYLPQGALAVAKEAEKSERHFFERMADWMDEGDTQGGAHG